MNNNTEAKIKCKRCGRSLVSMGHDRKNGKFQRDWAERDMHKKCWFAHEKNRLWEAELAEDTEAFNRDMQRLRMTDGVG
jgi:hypothetical protein